MSTSTWICGLTLGIVLAVFASAARSQSQEWIQRSSSGPSQRIYHAMVYDSVRCVTVLFGGRTFDSNGETWEWNGVEWTQRVVSGPSPRNGHAMAFDTARGVTVLFGGEIDTMVNSNDTWEWNGIEWTLREVAGPSVRVGHTMAYDITRGVTVLFGGVNGNSQHSDTWEWNGTAWTQRASSGPLPWFGQLAFDAVRGVSVLVVDDETWEWNGATWIQSQAINPSPGFRPAMVFDSNRRVTTLFGGDAYGASTWDWNGAIWIDRDLMNPPPRYGHAMAYDAARRAIVLFGGSISDERTWELVDACATGLIRDCIGNCAPGSWVGDGYCDDGYYAYNGVPIYFNCPQFGNDGGDCDSPMPPLMNPPNHNVPEVLPECELPAQQPGQTRLILLAHGKDTSAETFENYWEELAERIDGLVGPAWQVVAYDWTAESFAGIQRVLTRAVEEGECLGELIDSRNYTHVHLIGHSAGSAVIAEIARAIYDEDTKVHTTYLDAYGGIWYYPGPGDYGDAYGGNAHWSDHYFSQETIECGLPEHTGGRTQLLLPRCHNVDVSLADPNYHGFCQSTHTWPRCFYAFTVGTPLLNNCAAADAEIDLRGYGFPLAFEQWPLQEDFDLWLQARTLAYAPNPILPPEVLGDGDSAASMALVINTNPSLDLLSLMSHTSSSEAVQMTSSALTMTTEPLGSSGPAPSWTNFQIATTSDVNFVSFNLTFAGESEAFGLLTIYVDGADCGKIAQSRAVPGTQHYRLPTANDLAPGEHYLSFRLDHLNDLESSVRIQNIATGFGEFVPACRADFDEDGQIAVPDIFAFLSAWFAQDSRADFDGVPGITVSDIFAFLSAWFVGCP